MRRARAALALLVFALGACLEPVGFSDVDADASDTGDQDTIGGFDLPDGQADASDADGAPDVPDTGQPSRYCWEHGGAEGQPIAIALAENRLVVGLAEDNLVSVWELTLAGEVKQADLIPSSSVPESADFGAAVAVHGTVALAGGPQWPRGSDVGRVFRFERDGEDWSAGSPLVPDETTLGDQGFGSAVAVGLDHFAAGSAADHFLRLYPNGPPFALEDEVVWPASDEGFGTSVALEGDRVVVGLPLATDDTLVEAGHAVIYERLGEDDWQVETTLVSPNPTAGAHFGQMVALTSVTADLLAAVSEPETKMVHVYDHTETGWELFDSVSETADLYGQSIASFGIFLAVGAEDAAYLYRAEATGYDAVPGSPFISPDLVFLGIDFGAAVAVSDTWLVATAPAIDSVCAFELRRRGS